MGRVSGKVAIVTGAAQGLGAEIAARLAGEGAQVVLTDLNEQAGQASAAAIGGLFLKQDVSSESGWQELVQRVEQQFGRLDVLVNNAGLAESAGTRDPETAELEDWRRIHRVNVEGVFLGCKHAIPAIARAGGGSIINMSSIAALVPTPFIAAYGASKAAVGEVKRSVAAHLVAQFTRSVALHCAEKRYRIRCNSVHPGQIRTPMHDQLIAETARELGISTAEAEAGFVAKIPFGTFQEAIDIANAVLFLACDESRFITGTEMIVDGGMSLTN
jgi:3(or 17)beta-hydroxysteroid dehydrogenase